jgi:NADPH:quinone reductase-like Zn-dependent oxidoreductase
MLALTTPEQWQEMHKYIYAGLEAGFLDPVVSQSYDLADAPTAHKEVIAHTNGSQGKIIINIAE